MAEDAEALAWALEDCGRDVWFHHLVEEPWFIAGEAPLLAWLRAAGGEPLAAALERETRRRSSVDALRLAVRRHRRRAGLAGRVLAAEPPASEETRELARRLTRRLTHRGEDE
jgi:GNAT superfamily N-acetyltransferase